MHTSIYYSPSLQSIRLVEVIDTNGTDYHGLMYSWEDDGTFIPNETLQDMLLRSNFELIGNYIYSSEE